MASKNDITGDEIKSKASTSSYEDGWDRIFGKKENYTDGYPNDQQFSHPTEREKAVNKFNHLKECMEGQAHIDRPEYVDDVIKSVLRFQTELNEGEIEYIEIAFDCLREGTEWKF